MILVGSQALNQLVDDFARIPADVDLVSSFEEFRALTKRIPVKGCHPIAGGSKYLFKYQGFPYEVEIAWPGSTAEALLKIVERDYAKIVDLDPIGSVTIPPLNLLYALKMSHRFKKRSVHFLKTMDDIHFMRKHGAHVQEDHLEFFEDRRKEALNYAHPKLNTSAKEFFVETGDVKYFYVHDSIHEAVKHFEHPAYTYFQKKGDEIWNSRKMWDALPELTRLYSVLEEAYVLALERSHIPHPGVLSPLKAFTTAMEKVCTNISSGWWRTYAWENYHRVLELFDANYVERFKTGVQSGVVIPVNR